jgi:predicted enzyme related to lactoylglutathione lyase
VDVRAPALLEMETKMSDTPLGRFCWYDLRVPDPDAAPAFYGPVTGWGTTPYEGGGEPYTMWTSGEQPIGGVMALPEEPRAQGAPPHWLAYISTPDAAATAAKAVELGGTIMTQFDVPTVGSIAILADPQGVVFAAYEPEEFAPGHDGAPQVGEVSWHELYTDDWESGWAFYSALFGWEKTGEMEMGEAGTYHMYGREGQQLGGMMNRPNEDIPAMWFYYIRVPDIHAAVEAVKAGSGTVWNEPMQIPGGDMVAHCTDPQGAMFALHASA